MAQAPGADHSIRPRHRRGETVGSVTCVAVNTDNRNQRLTTQNYNSPMYYEMSWPVVSCESWVIRFRFSVLETRRLTSQHGRRAVPLSISSLCQELWVAWRDAEYVAHAAHAFDPRVLDACPCGVAMTPGPG